MNARLRSLFEQVEMLSEEDREALAARWEEELEEAKWEATFADPRSGPALDALVERAKEQVARGEVYDNLRDPE